MADLENGYTRVANEILDKLARTKLTPIQYRILFAVWRYTYGFSRKEHRLSLSFLSKCIGCEIRSVQRDLKKLIALKILNESYDGSHTRILAFNKHLEQWQTIDESVNDKSVNGETVNDDTDKRTIDESVIKTIDESVNQDKKKETIKESRRDVFDYYKSLGLIGHRKFSKAMDTAIKSAMRDNGYTIADCKALLDRHKRMVEATKNNEYPIRVRPLHEFFGQKAYNGKHLICAEYEEGGKYYMEPEQPKPKKHDYDAELIARVRAQQEASNG